MHHWPSLPNLQSLKFAEPSRPWGASGPLPFEEKKTQHCNCRVLIFSFWHTEIVESQFPLAFKRFWNGTAKILKERKFHSMESHALKSNTDYQNIWKSFTTCLCIRNTVSLFQNFIVLKAVNIYNIDFVNAKITDLTEKSWPNEILFHCLPVLARERTSTLTKRKTTSKQVDVAKAKPISYCIMESRCSSVCCKSGIVYFCIILFD